MERINSKKNKHMTLQDRIEIQECLSKGMTLKDIGPRIGKDQATVSKKAGNMGTFCHIQKFT